MTDIFISYSSDDRDRIQPLVRAFERSGYSVWWDHKIPIGRTFDEVIEEAIDAARCVVVVWTENSVQSRWVRTEASEGKRRDVLIPVMIDKVKVPLAFRLIETAQLADWDGESDHRELGVLMEALERHVKRPRPEGGTAAEDEPVKRELERRPDTIPPQEPPARADMWDTSKVEGDILGQLEGLLGGEEPSEPPEEPPPSEASDEDILVQLDRLMGEE